MAFEELEIKCNIVASICHKKDLERTQEMAKYYKENIEDIISIEDLNNAPIVEYEGYSVLNEITTDRGYMEFKVYKHELDDGRVYWIGTGFRPNIDPIYPDLEIHLDDAEEVREWIINLYKEIDPEKCLGIQGNIKYFDNQVSHFTKNPKRIERLLERDL